MGAKCSRSEEPESLAPADALGDSMKANAGSSQPELSPSQLADMCLKQRSVNWKCMRSARNSQERPPGIGVRRKFCERRPPWEEPFAEVDVPDCGTDSSNALGIHAISFRP